MKRMVEPGPSENLIHGKTGGESPPKSVVESVKKLLGLRRQRPNVENAGPEKLEEVKKANKDLPPAPIDASSLNEN